METVRKKYIMWWSYQEFYLEYYNLDDPKMKIHESKMSPITKSFASIGLANGSVIRMTIMTK
eukprot:UN10903